MLQSFEIRFSFFCRTSARTANNECPIVLRINFRSERKDVFTGLSSLPEKWDGHSQSVVGKDRKAIQTNAALKSIEVACSEKFSELKHSKKAFTLDQLIAAIKGKDQHKPLTTLDYLKRKTLQLHERIDVDITKATYQKYTRCIKHMELFLKKQYSAMDLPIEEVSPAMITDFFYFLRSEQNNSHNTSINYIKCLKTVLMSALKDGTLIKDPFADVKLAPKMVVRGFLSIGEIKSLEALTDLTLGLEQARDIFLFACYTGMAYIDVRQFSKRNLIRDHDGSLCIHKHRQKTGILSIIPLLKPAERILIKYSKNGSAMDFLWNVITNQKMNEHLKTLQHMAGIEQDMYFHLARHTFATTITLTNGVPLETVSEMLGHTNIAMTKRYAKMSGYKVKEDMKRIAGIFG